MDLGSIQIEPDSWKFLRDPQSNKQLDLFSLSLPSFVHFPYTGLASGPK